jgi:hypothetical protein
MIPEEEVLLPVFDFDSLISAIQSNIEEKKNQKKKTPEI